MTNTQRLKILYILEASTGGTFRHISDILTNLNREKFDITLIISIKRDPSIKEQLENFKQIGINIHIISMHRSISIWPDLRAFLAIRKIIKKEKFDIVHTHSSKAGILGRFASLATSTKKVIHTPHVFPFEMTTLSPLKKWLYILLEKIAGLLTDKIIAVCQAEKNTAIKKGIINENKLTVIHNGITPGDWQNDSKTRQHYRKTFNIPPETIVIGLIGRFMEQKGHKIFIDAIKSLSKKQRQNMKFVFIGDGPLKKQLQNLINQHDLTDVFTLVPYQQNIKPYYEMLDIIVLPSLWEAFPYTILEAMAMGKSIIAADTGGISEIITHNETGYLLPQNTASNLKSTILSICNTNKRTEIGQKAKEKATSAFTLSKMINKLELEYKR